MNKVLVCLAAALIAASASAGLIDHGDYTGFPNVNVDAHIVKIGTFYYPVVKEVSWGMPRAEAWRHDITEAAKGLDIPADKLEEFIRYVIDYRRPPVAAPHEKLLEFELYARGRYELLSPEVLHEMPPSWRRLFAMPLEKRRYVTIPVLYAWDNYSRSRRTRYVGYDDILETLAAARRLGCFDTQGCEWSILSMEPPQVHLARSFRRKQIEYNRLFRAYTLNEIPEKEWRYTNAMDIWRLAENRGDSFFSGPAMPALRYSLCCEERPTLRALCRYSPAIRDLIVAVGLTNRQMKDVRRVAFEFARESELNYPVLALRVPLAEAEKLLAGKPEHAALLDLLRLKKLSGTAKINAIDAYIAAYPDYTPKDMPVTSVALNTHDELRALAGLELLKLGRPREAMERWLNWGTPEDIAVIAEQIFTVDELLDFCIKHTSGSCERVGFVWADHDHIRSEHCARHNIPARPEFIARPAAEYLLRNILARRLMRERKFDEAQKWFTGRLARDFMGRFMDLREVLLDPKATREDKLGAALSLGALIRYRGDLLFGTFLEPDNTICDGRYRCEWGTKLPGLKLVKPDLPRFHYRWIAAEFYRRAAEYTDDPKLKGFCFWMAGTLLKNRDPKLADRDFKALFAVRPELTENNWFKPLSKCGAEVKELYQRLFFAISPRVTEAIMKLPEMKEVELPPHAPTAEGLFKLGERLYDHEDRRGRNTYEQRDQALCAYYVAGELGNAAGFLRCGMIYEQIDLLLALPFFRKALEMDKNCVAAKYDLGLGYLDSGHWIQGLALLRAVAADGSNRKLAGNAAIILADLYIGRKCGVTLDETELKHYLDIAAKSLGMPAEDIRLRLGEKQRAAEKRKAAEKSEK